VASTAVNSIKPPPLSATPAITIFLGDGWRIYDEDPIFLHVVFFLGQYMAGNIIKQQQPINIGLTWDNISHCKCFSLNYNCPWRGPKNPGSFYQLCMGQIIHWINSTTGLL
jgi:hypothetical protein